MEFLAGIAGLEADFTGIRCFEQDVLIIAGITLTITGIRCFGRDVLIMFPLFRNWWIGLTDFSHEGTWIWTHSNQVNLASSCQVITLLSCCMVSVRTIKRVEFGKLLVIDEFIFGLTKHYCMIFGFVVC